ncbi:transcription and mRNA export factor ENY2-like [Rhopilema esculentum]|uniref:transcription and mRNA export factor ENY2-like n=1 Tax=Rhopilema esculentum TaxID=499914 RepID=UPI0031DDB5BC
MPQMAQKGKEGQVKAKINQKMTESGEKERLQEMLRLKLTECGWRDELQAYCRSIVKEKGIDNVTVDMLIDEVTPKARSMVPDEVKRELFQRIKTFITEKAEIPS